VHQIGKISVKGEKFLIIEEEDGSHRLMNRGCRVPGTLHNELIDGMVKFLLRLIQKDEVEF
jgi:hypothetical protein